MISAEEARKKTQDCIDSRLVDSELEQIEEEINKAINNGKYEIFYTWRMHNETKRKLKKIGYKVTSYRDGVHIRWR